MEKYIEITDEDIAEVSMASSKGVTDVFNQLLKTVKARLVYPASSKLPQQFKNELFGALSSLLDQQDELAFKVEADSISYKDACVYKARSKTENFAHPFFRDGILEFKFKSGLTFEELEEFIEISSQMTRSAIFDDDAATLLWEAGFEHITYELMDDFLDIETFEYGTDMLKTGKSPSDSSFKDIFESEIDLNLTEEDFDLDSEKNKSSSAPAGYRNIEDNVAQFIGTITEFSDSEKDKVATMLRADAEFDHIKYAIDILFEILGTESDNASYNETMDLITKVGTDFIRTGDFNSVLTIIDRAKELSQIFMKLDDPKHEKMAALVEKFAASEKIRILVEYLNKARDVNFEDVTKYLKMLPWQAVDPLVWALGELDHYPARRAVCKALEVQAVDHPDILGKGTESPRWYVVRNVISILGRIGDKRAFIYFKRAIQHPDIRVRKETVLAAGRIVSDEAAEFLVTALNDKDEKIQTLALREIVEKKIIVAFEPVRALIINKEFKNRPAEQIRELLAGFAKLGGGNAFAHLSKIILNKFQIPSEKNERLKINAIRALGYIDTSESKALLGKLASGRNRKLGDMARRILNKVKKGDRLV
ncbi:MAG: HEAT repeat domain-containing protein [candidate division Zixibacteria bacterium]